MKYLKLFEDHNYTLPQDIVRNLKDICLELNDEYVETVCEYYPKIVSKISNTVSGGFISVGMEKMDITDYDDVLSWGDVSETISRIVEYLKSENWKLSSVNIDGEDINNPEKWLDNMRFKQEYSFWGLTMHFVEFN
jgi:hypothetical protein